MEIREARLMQHLQGSKYTYKYFGKKLEEHLISDSSILFRKTPSYVSQLVAMDARGASFVRFVCTDVP